MSPAPASRYSAALRGDQLAIRDFERIAELIGSEVGIRLHASKRSRVEARLRRRQRDLDIPSFAEYSDYLFRCGGLHTELPNLINVLTTNKTDFFREPQHFELLKNRLVPDLLTRRSERMPLIKVWSAACSTGAEAYTTAMVLADMAAQRCDFRFAILGTDVSTDVLREARIGAYSEGHIAPVPRPLQDRYCMWARRKGTVPDVRITPDLRRMTSFNYLNLMDTQYPVDRDVDIIFLRNVLIYFDKTDQGKVIDRLVSHLRPGGYLLLGHSESMAGNPAAVRQIAPATYQRI